MPIRLRHIVNVFASDDVEGRDPIYGRMDPAREEKVIDAFERCVGGKLYIAASATEDLPLEDVDTVRGFMIDADRGFDVVFNGGVDTIQVRPAVPPSVGTTSTTATVGTRARIFLEATVTQVAITNADSNNPLEARFVVWGDPTP